MADVCIKAGSYCPICRGTALADCWHPAGVFRVQPAPSAEPVAVVGDLYALFWIGDGPIAPLIQKHGINPGDHLYAHPPAAELEALRRDSARLDSGCIMTHERDEFGMEYKCERRGVDLRAAIDEAMAKEEDV